LFGRDVEIFELIRVQDIDYKQNMGERIINRGDIFIRGQDPSKPEIVLRNIVDPEKVYETLRKAWLSARKRHGLQFREFM
jgi:Bacterial PH domain